MVPACTDIVSLAFQIKLSMLSFKMVDMISDLKIQNTIIDCHNMGKNEVFVTNDSLFNEKMHY